MMKKLLPLLLILVLAGCGSQRDLAELEEKRPAWAKAKPVIAGYYTGIGAAPKTLSLQNYQDVARGGALKDIAEEISVNISSRSVLRSLEMEDAFVQEYTSNIATKSTQELEGYELVDTYEDSQYYFVFYKLSKAKFEEIRQERRNKAVNRALSLLKTYRQQRESGSLTGAITSAIKSLEVIRPHMHETLEVTLHNKQVDLGNHILNELQQTLRNIKITARYNEISTVRGSGIDKDQLTFRVESTDGMPVAEFPVSAAFSAQTLVNSRSSSDIKGIVAFSMDKVISQSRKGTFTVTTDMVTLLKKCTNDLLVRQVVRRMSTPSTSLEVQIISPDFYVLSEEKNLTSSQETNILKKAFSAKLHERGFSTTNKPGEAHFKVHINGTTHKGSEVKNMHVSWLTMEVTVRDERGAVVFSASESDIKGVNMDYIRAGEKAYTAGAEELKKRIFEDFYYQHFR